MTPPIIIDIEASGFGANGYPIEIGVIYNDVKRYCSLIQPFDDWNYWDEEAEQMHGISRQTLKRYGKNGVEVCLALNKLLSGQTVYSDGWVVDSAWLNQLFSRARVAKEFRLSSIELILKESQIEIWDDTKVQLQKQANIKRHRASNDALIIQRTFMETLNLCQRNQNSFHRP